MRGQREALGGTVSIQGNPVDERDEAFRRAVAPDVGDDISSPR